MYECRCDERQKGNTERSTPVYYKSIKRELKVKPISEYRCDERLKTKAEESTRLHTLGCSTRLRNAGASKKTFFFKEN
jgi:hypothetical protein